MSETHDPWAEVDRQMEALAAWSRTPPATFDELAQPIIGLVVAVNAARAEATQHQQEVATLRAERDNQYTQAVEATQRALLAEQALANVEAERDREGAEHERTVDEFNGLADNMERLIAERDRLKADQQDWRKGVALIASALGDKADDLSCVRIAEIALTLRAALEEAHALLKLFQTCYPAAIASLPENGMERMSAALTLSASPRTERHDEHDQARRCDAD